MVIFHCTVFLQLNHPGNKEREEIIRFRAPLGILGKQRPPTPLEDILKTTVLYWNKSDICN